MAVSMATGSGAASKEVAKRLSFGELSHSLHGPDMLVSQDVLSAVKEPSLERLEKAFEQFATMNSERFLKMLHVAQKQSENGDATDLQRLGKQLSMLKNSFQAFDIQEEFMSELLQGRPDGQEQQATEAAHSESQAWSEEVKGRKEVNNDTREKMRAAIAELASAHEEIAELQKVAGAELQGLRSAGARDKSAAASRSQGLQCEDPQITQTLEDLAAEARSLEVVTAEHQALASELEAAIASEQEELLALASEVEAMEEAAQSKKAAAPSPKSSQRFQAASAWYEELEALLVALTGVSLCNVIPDALELMLNTPVGVGADGTPEVLTHKLTLELRPGGDAPLLTGIALRPSDVPVADVSEAAMAASAAGRPNALSMAVKEVQARVSATHRRRAELQGVAALFAAREVEVGGETVLRCQIAGGNAEVEMRLPASWPAPGVCAEVADIQDVQGTDLRGPVLEALGPNHGGLDLPLADLLKRLDGLAAQAMESSSNHNASVAAAAAAGDAVPTAMCE